MTWCINLPQWSSIVGQWLYDWQTLIAGMAAVLVGGASIVGLRRQINQAEELANRSKRAQFNVARAKLSIAASSLIAHADHCLQIVDGLEPLVRGRSRQIDPVHVNEIPSATIAVLDRLLESSDDADISFAVSAIYAEQQVFSSRMGDIHQNPRSHALTIHSYYLQPILMHSLAINLLVFARREVDKVERLTWSDIAATARRAIRREPIRTELSEYIEQRAQRDASIPYSLNIDE